MIKARQKIKSYVMVIAMAILLLFLSIASITIYASASTLHGVDITGIDSLESYSLDFEIQEKIYYNQDLDIFGNLVKTPPRPYLNTFSRADCDVQLFFYFPNIKIEGQSVYFGMTTSVNLPAGISYNIFNRHVEFKLNKTKFSIALSNNYFLELQKMSVSNFAECNIMLVWKGVGATMLSAQNDKSTVFTLANSKLNVIDVPSGVVDPNDPNYDPNFGNNGENTAPDTALPDGGEDLSKDNQKWYDKIVAWVSSVFGVSTTVAIVIIIVGCVVVYKKVL